MRWRSPNSQSRTSRASTSSKSSCVHSTSSLAQMRPASRIFWDVFRLLRDIEATSLESAIGKRGGPEVMRNFNLDGKRLLRVCAETDDCHKYLVYVQDDSTFGTHIDRTTYEISILFDESDSGFEVVTENLTEHFNTVELHPIRGLDSSEAQLWIPRVSPLIGPNLYKEGTESRYRQDCVYSGSGRPLDLL